MVWQPVRSRADLASTYAVFQSQHFLDIQALLTNKNLSSIPPIKPTRKSNIPKGNPAQKLNTGNTLNENYIAAKLLNFE